MEPHANAPDASSFPLTEQGHAVRINQKAEGFFAELAQSLNQEAVALVRAAFLFSAAAHHGQVRKSGEPYIAHPLAVAQILAGWFLDPESLAAAFLHDVIEDTGVSKEELASKFGDKVAHLVEGLSKLEKIKDESKESAQAANFQKLLLASFDDVRVCIVKIADRLHNMQTLGAMREDKRRRIATETLEIYAPLANRLGINDAYQALEDLCLQTLHPHRYDVIRRAVLERKGASTTQNEAILAQIEGALAEANISADVAWRVKSISSIYRKMHSKDDMPRVHLREMTDLIGYRVIVKERTECYMALAALHALYKPKHEKFRDYIAAPKRNGYQSIHTTICPPRQDPIEVQIRTEAMHQEAQRGLAAHWKYKDKGSSEGFGRAHQKALKDLQGLLDLQRTAGDSLRFLDAAKADLFPDEIYVFTPKGDVQWLQKNATAVDFAYAVHSEVGFRCTGVLINNERMPLSTILQRGDRVEILTEPHTHPQAGWLNFVTTAKARASIRHYIESMEQKHIVKLGFDLLQRVFKSMDYEIEALDASIWDRICKELGYATPDDLQADIATGRREPMVVAGRMLSFAGWAIKGIHLPDVMKIRGTEGMAVKFAPCCHPIPGDPILGLMQKNQGLVIHTHGCSQLAKKRATEEGPFLDVAWDADLIEQMFTVPIRVVVKDQIGVLAQVCTVIAQTQTNIDVPEADALNPNDAYKSLKITLSVSGRVHLARVMRALRQLESVVRVERV